MGPYHLEEFRRAFDVQRSVPCCLEEPPEGPSPTFGTDRSLIAHQCEADVVQIRQAARNQLCLNGEICGIAGSQRPEMVRESAAGGDKRPRHAHAVEPEPGLLVVGER